MKRSGIKIYPIIFLLGLRVWCKLNFQKIILMVKQARKKFTKEWVELTLCDMVDEVLQLM